MKATDTLFLPAPAQVEVFRTNVQNPLQARALVEEVRSCFPHCAVNFDLEDCDRILRVEGAEVDASRVADLLRCLGFACALLED